MEIGKSTGFFLQFFNKIIKWKLCSQIPAGVFRRELTESWGVVRRDICNCPRDIDDFHQAKRYVDFDRLEEVHEEMLRSRPPLQSMFYKTNDNVFWYVYRTKKTQSRTARSVWPRRSTRLPESRSHLCSSCSWCYSSSTIRWTPPTRVYPSALNERCSKFTNNLFIFYLFFFFFI